MSLEITPVDIYQMIQEMSSLLYVNAEERGLSFIVEQVPQLPRRIDVDGGKLRQTLINLIGNAIKYTKRGGIVLRAKVAEKRAEQMRLRFEVEDTGPGISEEDRKKLFKPFMQLNGQSAAVTGTGLGLSISRQFVELMGGQIDVISEKGKGSLFFFEIPVKELPLEELEVVHEHGRAIGLEEGQPRYRLLIAEDQLENRLLLHKILQSFEFDIREAANGREAVEIFEQWHPDLIWMDMRMPIMDGLDATHRIRATEAGEHTKIIALTAQAFEEDRVKIMQAGCDDFIRKPYRDIELFDALTRHLGLRFIYEKKAAAPSSGPEMKLKPEQLGALPQDLVNKLHQAVEGLDPERINDVINKITQHDPPIGGALQKLANRLDYDHLLQLLDEYVKIITGKHC
jgi:CheY-like chemotaxis protein